MIKPNGLTEAFDWPRLIKYPEHLKNTRRWCQMTRRNYLQDGWNGRYEFFMFEKRERNCKSISSDFTIHMNDMTEEEYDSRSDSPGSQGSISWANELQITEGDEPDVEETPFSDDESVQIDFPEEGLNLWDDREWRQKYAIAIKSAFQKVYDHNETVKNGGDPKLKPKDLDPHLIFVLQQIAIRDKDEIEKAEEALKLQENKEVEIEDQSDVTSTSIHGYDTDNNTIDTNEGKDQEGSLNDAVLSINSDLLEEGMTEDLVGNEETEEDTNLDETVQSEGTAEVLLIERQEEVITLQEENEAQTALQELNSEESNQRNVPRFDFQDFKARLLKFKNRETSESCHEFSNKKD